VCYPAGPVQIGEILIERGHLTPEGLEEALDWQVLYGGRLGTNLLELQLCEEEHLARGLAKQHGCEVAWGNLEIDPALVGVIPPHIAQRDEMVPWKLERRRLKVLVTRIDPGKLDQLSYKIGKPCTAVVAPEFRVINLLRAHYGAMRQMRALDFGVVPDEGRLGQRKKAQQQKAAVQAPGELIDEKAFNDIYAQVLAGRSAPDVPVGAAGEPAKASAAPPATASAAPPAKASAARPAKAAPSVAKDAPSAAKPTTPPASRTRTPPAVRPPPPVANRPPPPVANRPPPELEPWPEAPPEVAPPAPVPAAPPEPVADAQEETTEKVVSEEPAIETLPEDAILGEAAPPPAPPPRAAPTGWDAPPLPARTVDVSPLAFEKALELLKTVQDRDSIARIVLRASRSKAERALLLLVQGNVVLGWDGLGEGLEEGAAARIAVALGAPSAFDLVVKTRSHFLGPLQKTPLNIRFLAQMGKKVPLSSLVVPILHRERVSHVLYLDNGHKKQAPTDVGEMLILSQRIAQSVEALVVKRKAGRT